MVTQTPYPIIESRTLERTRNTQRKHFDQAVIIGTLTALLVLTLIPIFLMVVLSLKDNGQIYGRFWSAPDPIRWQNYTSGVEVMINYIRNTLLYSSISVAGVVILSSLTGYTFARHQFPFKNTLYLLILALLMIPSVLLLIPSFVLVKDLGLLNTPWALILPWTSGGQVLGTLLCRTFFATLLQELFESGKIDGASEFQLYLRIAVPLSWPVLITLAIMHFVATYNDFIWPLLTLSSPDLQVVSVGLTQFTSQFGVTDWGPRMAAYVVATVPLLLLFTFGMRYYVRGITAGAIKA
jgi:ABC-type glycerol-3-phosphate transport system permease component